MSRKITTSLVVVSLFVGALIYAASGRDLARVSREFLDEYDGIKVEAVDFTAIKTPAEWNTLGRESIMRNYDMMRPRTQLLFFERFEDWFNA